MASMKDKALAILKAQHNQNLADINATKNKSIKQLNLNTANAVARTGMNWSSIKPMLSREGEAQISTDAARNRNLENINYSQLMLDILQKYAGSGRPKAQTQPTKIPTRDSIQPRPTGITGITSGGSSPSLNQAVRNGTVPWQAAQAYTGARGNTNTRRTQRQIMDERLGLA